MRRPHVIVYLEPAMLEALRASARMHRRGVSGEARTAIREYLSRLTAQLQDAQAAPILDALLRERIGELETWLRPMMAATSIHAATAVLLALEPRLLSHPVTLQFGPAQSCRCIFPGPTETSRAHIRPAWTVEAPVPLEDACTFRTMLAARRLYFVAFAVGQRLNPGASFLKTSISFRPATGPAA